MKITFVAIISLCCAVNCIFAQAPRVIIDGYTDKLSYRAGETVTFFINASSTGSMDINILAMNGTTAASLPSVHVDHQTPFGSEPWVNGFGYAASSFTWTIPTNLPSGRYLIQTVDQEFPIPIIIKAPSFGVV